MVRSARRAWVFVVVVLAVVASVAGCSPRFRGDGDQVRHLNVGGLDRTYRVHTPAGRAAGLPVVLAFHGGLGQDPGMVRLTGFDRLADERGFVAVYPDGYRRSWNDGRGNTPAARDNVDDVAFTSAVIDDLVARDRVDAKRVFATGMSNGGMFTERLGCDLAGKLAGIAPVAGELPVAVACRPARPIPVLEIHGTGDPIVPYGGGHVDGRGDGGDVLSTSDTMNRWRSVDGCAGTPAEATLPDRVNDGTQVRTLASAGCPVILYTVDGGGHTWPGGPQYLPRAMIGPTSGQFDASTTIWDFFAKGG